MSSHLTISYASQTTPGANSAGVTAAGAPAATENPLGFLAALVDQLLAGGAEAGAAVKNGSTDATPPQLDSLAGFVESALASIPSPEAHSPDTRPAAPALAASLSSALDDLALTLDAGAPPEPGELDRLIAAMANLSAALAAPRGGGTKVPEPDANGDRPPAGVAIPAVLKAPLPPIAAPSGAHSPVAHAEPLPSDAQILALLSELGLIEPRQEASAATSPAPASANPELPPAAAALRDKLVALSTALAATAPQLSRQLADLAAKVEVYPERVAGGPTDEVAADPQAATIATIVRALLGREPVRSVATPATEATSVPASPEDDLLRVLATLGLDTAPAAGPGTILAGATPPALASTPSPALDFAPSSASVPSTGAGAMPALGASAGVPAPLVRLSTQLSQVSAALRDSAPELSAKVEKLAASIVSSGAPPDLLGRLESAAAQADGAPLDRLVKTLIDMKPAAAPVAAPQTVATPRLDIPSPIAPASPKPAEVRVAPPAATPASPDPLPDPIVRTTVANAADAPPDSDTPQTGKDSRLANVIADASGPGALQSPSPATPAGGPQPVQAQAARPLPAAYQPVANPINMGQVAFEMVRQAHQGSSRFTLRLDPPELGRVDVKMHVDASGALNARLTVERAETLDLFQRDQRSLERALAQAGLDSSRTNLEFSLRQNHNPFSGMMGGEQHNQPGSQGGRPRFALEAGEEASAAPAITLYRGIATAGGVNIFA